MYNKTLGNNLNTDIMKIRDKGLLDDFQAQLKYQTRNNTNPFKEKLDMLKNVFSNEMRQMSAERLRSQPKSMKNEDIFQKHKQLQKYTKIVKDDIRFDSKLPRRNPIVWNNPALQKEFKEDASMEKTEDLIQNILYKKDDSFQKNVPQINQIQNELMIFDQKQENPHQINTQRRVEEIRSKYFSNFTNKSKHLQKNLKEIPVINKNEEVFVEQIIDIKDEMEKLKQLIVSKQSEIVIQQNERQHETQQQDYHLMENNYNFISNEEIMNKLKKKSQKSKRSIDETPKFKQEYLKKNRATSMQQSQEQILSDRQTIQKFEKKINLNKHNQEEQIPQFKQNDRFEMSFGNNILMQSSPTKEFYVKDNMIIKSVSTSSPQNQPIQELNGKDINDDEIKQRLDFYKISDEDLSKIVNNERQISNKSINNRYWDNFKQQRIQEQLSVRLQNQMKLIEESGSVRSQSSSPKRIDQIQIKQISPQKKLIAVGMFELSLNHIVQKRKNQIFRFLRNNKNNKTVLRDFALDQLGDKRIYFQKTSTKKENNIKEVIPTANLYFLDSNKPKNKIILHHQMNDEVNFCMNYQQNQEIKLNVKSDIDSTRVQFLDSQFINSSYNKNESYLDIKMEKSKIQSHQLDEKQYEKSFSFQSNFKPDNQSLIKKKKYMRNTEILVLRLRQYTNKFQQSFYQNLCLFVTKKRSMMFKIFKLEYSFCKFQKKYSKVMGLQKLQLHMREQQSQENYNRYYIQLADATLLQSENSYQNMYKPTSELIQRWKPEKNVSSQNFSQILQGKKESLQKLIQDNNLNAHIHTDPSLITLNEKTNYQHQNLVKSCSQLESDQIDQKHPNLSLKNKQFLNHNSSKNKSQLLKNNIGQFKLNDNQTYGLSYQQLNQNNNIESPLQQQIIYDSKSKIQDNNNKQQSQLSGLNDQIKVQQYLTMSQQNNVDQQLSNFQKENKSYLKNEYNSYQPNIYISMSEDQQYVKKNYNQQQTKEVNIINSIKYFDEQQNNSEQINQNILNDQIQKNRLVEYYQKNLMLQRQSNNEEVQQKTPFVQDNNEQFLNMKNSLLRNQSVKELQNNEVKNMIKSKSQPKISPRINKDTQSIKNEILGIGKIQIKQSDINQVNEKQTPIIEKQQEIDYNFSRLSSTKQTQKSYLESEIQKNQESSNFLLSNEYLQQPQISNDFQEINMYKEQLIQQKQNLLQKMQKENTTSDFLTEIASNEKSKIQKIIESSKKDQIMKFSNSEYQYNKDQDPNQLEIQDYTHKNHKTPEFQFSMMQPIIQEDISQAKKKLDYEQVISTSKKIDCNFDICFQDKKSLDPLQRSLVSNTFLKNSFGNVTETNQLQSNYAKLYQQVNLFFNNLQQNNELKEPKQQNTVSDYFSKF